MNLFNNFRRVSAEHILDLSIGTDARGNQAMLLVSSIKPTKLDMDKLYSTYAIDISVGYRDDGKSTLLFSLLDKNFREYFDSFCKDIISSSAGLKCESEGFSYIASRYAYWMRFFSKEKSGRLSDSQIKGLIGELLVLVHKGNETGMDTALYAWIGTDATPQDFVFKDKWIEVKTTSRKNKTIQISSIEQLDSEMPGALAVVKLEKTSSVNEKGLSLNKLVDEIRRRLDDISLEMLFMKKLTSLGYCSLPYYENECFLFYGCDEYFVDEDFPCLRRRDIKYNEITDASYGLDITKLPIAETWEDKWII